MQEIPTLNEQVFIEDKLRLGFPLSVAEFLWLRESQGGDYLKTRIICRANVSVYWEEKARKIKEGIY